MKPLSLLKYKLFTGYDNQNQKIVSVYQDKIIQYGRFTAVHHYNKIKCSFSSERITDRTDIPKPKSDYSFTRAKQRVFQIIEANHKPDVLFGTAFITLTFREQHRERKIADRQVRLFIKRLERYRGYKAEYIFVPERHKSGSLHYHGLIFNWEYIPVQHVQNKIYKYGYFDLKLPKKIHRVIGYVSKYITKDIFKQVKRSEKAYLASRNLIYPQQTLGFYEKPDTVKLVQEVAFTHKKITKYAKI